MIDDETRARIRRLYYAERWKIGTIAAALGLHRETVALAIESWRFRNARFRASAMVLDPYRDFVRATLEQYPRLRSTRLLEMIRDRGYTGSVFPLRRYVRKVRPVPTHEAFFRLSTLPGEEAQVDWGSFGKIRVGHTDRLLSCFVMVLSWSRATFARFTLDQTLESFLRCHTEAFELLGGVPRAILYDNLKSVVLERHGELIRFHPPATSAAGTSVNRSRTRLISKPWPVKNTRLASLEAEIACSRRAQWLETSCARWLATAATSAAPRVGSCACSISTALPLSTRRSPKPITAAPSRHTPSRMFSRSSAALPGLPSLCR